MTKLKDALQILNKYDLEGLPLSLLTPIDISDMGLLVLTGMDAAGIKMKKSISSDELTDLITTSRDAKFRLLLDFLGMTKPRKETKDGLRLLANMLPGMQAKVVKRSGHQTVWTKAALLGLWRDVDRLQRKEPKLSAAEACRRLATQQPWQSRLEAGRAKDKRSKTGAKSKPLTDKSAADTLYSRYQKAKPFGYRKYEEPPAGTEWYPFMHNYSDLVEIHLEDEDLDK